METKTLHYDRIPIERSWGLSMRFHDELGHTDPWEICGAGCDTLADEAIRILFGTDRESGPTEVAANAKSLRRATAAVNRLYLRSGVSPPPGWARKVATVALEAGRPRWPMMLAKDNGAS